MQFASQCYLLADNLLAVELIAQDGGEAAPSLGVQILNNPMTLIVGLFLLFYFIVLLPERRRKAEEARMLSTLKKNEKIITIGGIHGTVVSAPENSNVVTIKIDDNTRMKVNRSAIASVVREKEGDGKGKESGSQSKDG